MNVISSSEEKIEFILDASKSDIIQELRRYLMYKIPVMAFSVVQFERNQGLRSDGEVSRDMFFLPIHCNPDDFKLHEECSCYDPNDEDKEDTGCDRCQVIYDLDVLVPLGELRNVTTFDLKKRNPEAKAEILNYVVAGEPRATPFTKLGLRNPVADSVGIKATCKARLGFGDKHARWRYCQVVVALPHDDGTKFIINMDGQLPADYVIRKAQEFIDNFVPPRRSYPDMESFLAVHTAKKNVQNVQDVQE